MAQVPDLSTAWTAWCRFLAQNDPSAPDSSAHPVIAERLRRLHPKHRAEVEPIDAVVYTLYRGVPLLMAALGWEEPRAGGSSAKPTPTDSVRGEQWRLVMAFGGFEAVVRAVLTHADASPLTPQHFDALVRGCQPPEYQALPPPALREPERDRWFQTGLGARADLVRRLLGLTEADANAVGKWLAEQQPVCSWPAALQLAQAFRNATVHGALSASKVREWKLRPAFRTLNDNLGTVTAAVLTRLTAEPVPAVASAASPKGRGRNTATSDEAAEPALTNQKRPRAKK
jgi:hypothetical protein